MILNVSGRTDIVAFYTKWFVNRYKEGFLDVRNPFNPKLVSRINFDNVDLIMFCTKNPLPIIKYLKLFKEPILFHITLTPYLSDIEPNVVNKKEIIEGIKKISKIIGKENTVVRYDPIFISYKYSIKYHLKMFDRLCSSLDGYIDKIVVSFLDEYKNTKNNKNILKYKDLDEDDLRIIGTNFSNSAKKHNIVVQTCYEKRNLVEYGFVKGECLSLELAYKMTNKIFKKWKARDCNCAEMVDIGYYNSCNHLCKYCYANYDEKVIGDNIKNHDPNSTLLIGSLEKDDIIKERLK